MAMKRVVVLVGGVGGAKFALGLARILSPECLTVIVNTGDDFSLYGLRICPDLDTVMYTLAGVVDPVNGWGLSGDTTTVLNTMQTHYGETPWFRLGDRDLATHVLRSQGLNAGQTLTQVTQDLAAKIGVKPRLLPMTDTPVPTMVDTLEYGELEFQEYFVRHRWQPTVRQLRYAGMDDASLTPDVRTAIADADAILVGPSNPWLSIEPILRVPGLRELILARNVPRVAISPIVSGRALKGPAAKLMAELGYEVSAITVAQHYGDVLNGFVYDVQDAHLRPNVHYSAAMNTIMHSEEDKAELARRVLGWIESW